MSAQNATTLTHGPLSMADIPLSPEAKITVERRGQIVLIGVNRPQAGNRVDPDAFFSLARAYHDFDNDPSLRAAVFFGLGETSPAASTWTPSRPWPGPASRSRSPTACSTLSPGPSTSASP